MSVRRGTTLLEVLVTLLIIGVLAALGVDLFSHYRAESLQGAARMLEQDVEWARSATLANPDDPASILLLDDGTGWMVVRQSAPNTPVTASDGTSMRRVLGEGMAACAAGTRISLPAGSTRSLEFEAYGGVRTSPNNLEMILPDSKEQCLIIFDLGTGQMQVQWPNPEG